MYDNTNKISLWLNDRREKLAHPHLKGQGETDTPVWASAWLADDLPDEDKRTIGEIIKRHRAASKPPFLTVSMTPKESIHSAPAPKEQRQNPQVPPHTVEDIPF